jgi:hypothetical protein
MYVRFPTISRIGYVDGVFRPVPSQLSATQFRIERYIGCLNVDGGLTFAGGFRVVFSPGMRS